MISTPHSSLFMLSKKNLAQALLGCFFVVTLIAPAAFLNKILFVALSFWLLWDMLLASDPAVVPVAPPAVVAVIFLYGYCMSLFTRSDPALAMQFLLSVLILFQIYFVRRYDIDVEKLVMVSSLVMVAATILLWLARFWDGMPLGPDILAFMRRYGLSAISERDFFEEVTLSLHLGSAPFLFVGLGVFGRRLFARFRASYLLCVAMIILAILLSASRGIIAGAVMLLVMLAIAKVPKRARLPLVAALMLLAGYGLNVLLSDTLLLSASEVSNMGKLGHVQSFLDQLTATKLLFGDGLASI
jgi:hypothetical protein